jgi:hypothetical protein
MLSLLVRVALLTHSQVTFNGVQAAAEFHVVHLEFVMVCRNRCDRLYSKIIFGKSHYEGGKKYCRRCEVYYYHEDVFCTCCGMALRMSPTNKRDKEKIKLTHLGYKPSPSCSHVIDN